MNWKILCHQAYGVLSELNKALGTVTAPPPAATMRTEPPLSAEHTTPSECPDHTGAESRTTPKETHPPIIATTPTTEERLKLPKISLPHFRSNLMRWPAFWDSYNSAIHTNDSLSEIDKFNYLRSLPAYDAIARLALSAANYGEAVEILKKRFGGSHG